jgi:hypothetical protein
VHIPNLIRIHETRIAHHVASVGKVNGQHSTASKFDVRCAMMMNMVVLGGFKITSKKERFDPLEEIGVRCKNVFKFAVCRAGFPHQDLAVFLDDLSFDLAGMGVHQNVQWNVP